MNLNFLRRALDFGIYSSFILLLFLLAFEHFLVLPGVLSWLGRWHPLILHFPIVLILVTIVQYWRNDPYRWWYLSVSTFFTLISALTGFLLSLESGGSKGGLILTHQWLGVSVALLMLCWYWFFQGSNIKYVRILQGLVFLAIVLTGHFGGMVTHGEDFLTPDWMKSESSLLVSDDLNVYSDLIQPILDKRCVSCHNPNKSKGELNLEDYNSLLTGGENGAIINASDLQNSALVQVINFPMDNEYHMPPKEEKQLSPEEIEIIGAWVSEGAQDTLLLSQLTEQSELYQFGKAFIERSRNDKWKEFPEVSDGDLSDLSSDYCTILRMYNGSNALQVRIFSERNYSIELLKNLKPISENIIELDLLGLPIGGGEMKLISGFVNLEKLNLANTGLTDLDFLELENMKHLKSLKVYGTQISDSALESISNFPELTDLYVYDTDISDKGIENLNSTYPEINVIAVSKEAGSFKSVLPSPKIDPRRSFFSDPFYIKATLPLNGIDILFTRDGATPNDQSSKMSDSLEIDTSFKFKYLASKTGWEPSKVDSVMFFKSSFIPQDYTLENGPNSKYTGNGKIILFDLEKGPADYSDSAWMAFREASFILSCNFEKEVTLGAIVLSSIIQTDQYLFPPQSVKIYGGMEHGNLKLIGALKPSPLKERQQGHFEFYTCQTNTSMIKYLKIIVEPLEKLPIWHQGKGQPAWFFIDEVVLMEESPSF